MVKLGTFAALLYDGDHMISDLMHPVFHAGYQSYLKIEIPELKVSIGFTISS